MKNKQFILFIIGFILVQVFIKFLKKVIKQKRPVGAKSMDYGMPSRRAGMTLFIVSYLLLFIDEISISSFIISIIFIIGNLGLKFLHNEHSIPQLFVGSIIGIIFGCIFNKLTNVFN